MQFPHALTAPAAVLLLAATLAACGDDTGGSSTAGPSDRQSSQPTAEPTGTPAAGERNDADVMFVMGMIPHHAQAVQMSDLVLAKDGVDPEVVALAEQIKAAQGPEIEQMRGWLAGWGLPVPDPDDLDGGMGDMEGMDHGGGGTGSGMMSDADVAELEDAEGPEAGRLFLSQMIVHHQGAIMMAREELRAGANADAKRLAEDIVTAQKAEIETMTRLLG